MPRRSAASQSVMPVTSTRAVMKPPPGLSDAAAVIWKQIVAATPANHFRASDAPLLRSYCESTAIADNAAAQLATHGAVIGGKASPWLVVQEKALRSQATLALRLRLCPSARQDPKTAARAQPTPAVLPWEES